MLVLGVETSCDETAASVVEDGRIVRANVVSSQIATHAQYGGVVPEVASRQHVDSFRDLAPEAAASFGALCGRVEDAILGLGDVGRVHLYRWGDGGAHFHVWFLPRPLGMLEASGMALPLWEDVLPNVPDEELRAAAEGVAKAM